MKIRFSGFGGQGIVMAGLVTGAAAVRDGNNALQTQSYGSASRGGSCKSDVVISREAIYDLEFHEPDILVCMSQEAYDKFSCEAGPDTLVFIDSDLVKPTRDHKRVFSIPATEIAYKEFKRKIVSNLVILGCVMGAAQAVSCAALEATIRERVPKGTEDLNLNAFRAGFAQGSTMRLSEGA